MVFRLLAGCMLVLGTACTSGTEPGDVRVLAVVPAVSTIPADSSMQFRVAEITMDNDTVYLAGAAWSSRSPDVASVSPDGVVTGLRSGTVTIVALAGDRRGTLTIQVERPFHATDVSTGSAGLCAVDLDGRVWCEGGWGSGASVPTIDATDPRTFTVPVAGSERYTLVGSNQRFACGLATTGRALCWGSSLLGSNLSAGAPTPIAASLTFDTLSIESRMGCGLAQFRAFCWGLRFGTVKPIDASGNALLEIGVGVAGGCGWTADDQAICWDEYGMTVGTTVSRAAISRAATPALGGDILVLHGGVSGGDFTCGIDDDQHAWCWGKNENGQLGRGTLLDGALPAQVTGDRQFTLLAASVSGASRRVCGITVEQELLCWGRGFGPVPSAVLY